MKVLFVWPNKDAFGFKPIGISLLSGIARREGWETRLFDTTEFDFGFVTGTEVGERANLFKAVDMSIYGHQKTKRDLARSFTNVLEEFNPDCIAISVLSEEYLVADRISRIAKESHPKLPIIWGGKYPTLAPERALMDHSADFVCVAEGLEAFRDFLEAIAGKRDVYNIRNIWGKRNGSIIRNEIRPLKKDLDNLPYLDWEIMDKRQFYRPFDGKAYVSGDHMLNWGCPYRCSYCINDYTHKQYNNKYFVRRYSVKRIIEELKYLTNRYGLNFFRFLDEDFLMRPLDNLRELSNAYRNDVNIPFAMETNPKTVTEEKVILLKEMNCVNASVAIETGDPSLRRSVLNRVDSEADIIRAFSLFNDANIRNSCFIMLGIPFETRDSYRKTVELVRKANAQYLSVGFLYPFEGTKIREISIKEGFFDPEEDEKKVNKYGQPALRFRNLSEGDLIEMHNVFSLYVKLPKVYEPFIRRSEKLDDVGKKLRRKLIYIFNKTVFDNDGGTQEANLVELNGIMKQD